MAWCHSDGWQFQKKPIVPIESAYSPSFLPILLAKIIIHSYCQVCNWEQNNSSLSNKNMKKDILQFKKKVEKEENSRSIFLHLA